MVLGKKKLKNAFAVVKWQCCPSSQQALCASSAWAASSPYRSCLGLAVPSEARCRVRQAQFCREIVKQQRLMHGPQY